MNKQTTINIIQEVSGTVVSGILNEPDMSNYMADTVVCEHLGDNIYSFYTNAQDVMGNGTVTKDALRMYRDAIIAMIGRE